ncbi:MAG TPA: hypothetical protein VK253_07840 [Candidatus Binatia bacterium]|nr:hypothetical protein [Candidatus Binatia bacterium]
MKSNKTERDNLGESLVESLGASDLPDIAVEASDIALDIALNDGLLKDIPIFGWLAKAYSTYRSITDRMFLKKVALFLSGVSNASATDREKFKDHLNSEPEFRKKVGENLLLLIDRHERLEKSYLLGKLMAKVVEGKCSSDVFLRIAAALDHSTVEDLEALQRHSQYIKDLPESIQQSLYKSHLLDMEIHAVSVAEPYVNISITYKLNSLGEKLLEYALSTES